MDQAGIQDLWERFFEKYKKTEGDRTVWSAFWTETMPSGAGVEINLTKCPRGTIFKVFRNGRKLGELTGWEAFFAGIGPMLGPDWDAEAFFGSMADMV